MEKLEAVQKVLRFSDRIRAWVEGEHSVYFDDLDEQNVQNFEMGGYGELADKIIAEGVQENLLDEDDLRDFS